MKIPPEHSAQGGILLIQIVNRKGRLAVKNILPGDTAADGADQLVVEGIACFCQFLCRKTVAHQYDLITSLHIGDIRHIHHHLVHADSSQNGGFLTFNQHIELAG